MIAIGEHAPLALGELIESAGDADLERAQTASERVLVLRLDDEVQMRVLEREVNDAEVSSPIMQRRVD
jgi:hypothetical protein